MMASCRNCGVPRGNLLAFVFALRTSLFSQSKGDFGTCFSITCETHGWSWGDENNNGPIAGSLGHLHGLTSNLMLISVRKAP